MILKYEGPGPYMEYRDGVFHIRDLNPELHIKWGMARWELFRLACKCFVAAMRRDEDDRLD
jgi:hypothetical protein